MAKERWTFAGLTAVTLLTGRVEIGPGLALTVLGALVISGGMGVWCWSDEQRTHRLVNTIRTVRVRHRRQ